MRSNKLILTLLLALTFLSVRAEDPELNLQGEGTRSNPYLITNQADLMTLARACQNGKTGAASGHFDGKYFKQTADIDMSGVTDFYGIGTAPDSLASSTAFYFGGKYDGGNFRIKNLVINGVKYDPETGGIITKTSPYQSRFNCGIFGDLKNGASVSNLIVDKSCKFYFYSYSGAITGRLEEGCSLKNCVNEADIYSYNNNIGGIAGYVYGKAATKTSTIIYNCVNKGNIYGVGQYVAGIAGGVYYAEMDGLINFGNVTGKPFDNHAPAISPTNPKYYGGIAGMTSGADITNAWNVGTIYGASDFTGGITGMCRINASLGKMENCISLGSVSSGSINRVGIVTGQNGNGSSNTSAPTNPIVLNNVYYDSQLSAAMAPAVGNGDISNVTGKTTAELTNGTLPMGLSTIHFKAEAGFYPIPLSAEDDGRIAAAAYFLIPNNGTTLAFVGPAQMSTAISGLSFRLANNKDFTLTDGKLTLKTTNTIVSDTLFISYNNKVIRPIPVENWPEKPFPGEGTETSPYLIGSKADVMALMRLVNDKQNHLEGIYFRQTADIDMQRDPEFIGIGAGNGVGSSPETMFYFSGNYDGDGHTISNMVTGTNILDATGKAISVASGGYNNVGFFGALNATAVVKNLNIDSTCVVYGWARVGGIAGRMASGAKIDGCTFAGKIYSYQGYGGGIAGYIDSPGDGTYPSVVSNCLFFGEVNVNHQYGGGIAGQSKSLIENCVSAGYVHNYIFNTATTKEANTGNAGGITGYNGGEVRYCSNFSNVTAYDNAGGLVGMINTYYKGGKTTYSFSSGMVECATGQESKVGSIIGNVTKTNDKAQYGVISALYYDGQLASLPPYVGESHPGIHALSTDTLTTAIGIDSLSSGFEFVNGLYPLPKTFVNNVTARQAASVFFKLTYPQTLKTITSAAPINDVYPLTATLKHGNVFSIRDNRLVPGFTSDLVADTLTLTIGSFSRSYPISQEVANFLEGEGTAENPWKITSAVDMNRIAANALINYTSYEGEYFILANDIDYTGVTPSPIGRLKPFAGNFDGKGHTISNFKIEGNSTYQGIFGQTEPTAVLKNIVFVNCSVQATAYGALLVGRNAGTIANIKVEPSNKVEGVFVSGTSGNRGDYLASIAGYSTQTAHYYDIENRGAVTGYCALGGIVGYTTPSKTTDTDTMTIERCVNYGPITSTAHTISDTPNAYAGGIVGYLYGIVKNCVNHGTITSKEGQDIGGIVGIQVHYSVVDSCYNHGRIISESSSAGGIVGHNYPTSGGDKAIISSVSNCGNDAPVVAKMNAGGIVGKGTTRIEYVNCFNTAPITAVEQGAGGIMGVSSGMTNHCLYIRNCYNTASIAAPMKVAGLAGFADNTTKANYVSHSFNTGTVTQLMTAENEDIEYSCAAGIVNGAARVTNCYNTADIKGWNYVGGIIGLPTESACQVDSCYNLGDVTAAKPNSPVVGSISGNLSAPMTNCYANKEYGHNYMSDRRGKVNMLTLQEMTSINLGEEWIYADYCFPRLKGFDDLDVAKAYSAYFNTPLLGLNDIPYEYINLATLEGVVWTANNLMTIDGAKANIIGDGEGMLTATCGTFSRSYLLQVAKDNSVGGVSIDEIIATEYYSLDGTRLVEPIRGCINIVVLTTADGRRITRKLYVK